MKGEIFMKMFSIHESIVFLMRGLPGTGKSTWLKEKGVEDYVISPDSFRLILSPPVRQKNGEWGINQAVSKTAWEMTYASLKSRIENCINNVATGATFVDATFCHERTIREMVEFINKYGEGKIRIVVVDFFNTTPITIVKARNEGRKGTIRYVPPFVIERMYESAVSMNTNDFGIEFYSPEEIQFSM